MPPTASAMCRSRFRLDTEPGHMPRLSFCNILSNCFSVACAKKVFVLRGFFHAQQELGLL